MPMRKFDGYATGSRAESSAAPLSRSARQEPRSRFASGRNNNASFIGAPAMNLIKGSMTADGLRTEDGVLLPTSGRPGNAAIYGIRPENIHLDPNGIPVKIIVLEPTGSETLVIAKLGNHSINCVIRERIRVAPGDTLRISPDVSAVHLFDTGGART